jgi:hypothetical protein
MKKIAFMSGQLGLRGTEIALYDYAHFNETVLNNQSIILYPKTSTGNHPQAVSKFEQRFTCLDSTQNIDQTIEENGIDLLYTIKSGAKGGFIAKNVPTSFHAVFPANRDQADGSAYAFVSHYLSRVHANNKTPFVPHIVYFSENELKLTTNLREKLNIPHDATVFGCYGGEPSFNVRFVKQRVIPYLLKKRPDIYFIFMNIDRFIIHDRVHFLEGSSKFEDKGLFIRTCDAMIHARKIGETFGLAIGEFSLFNKPVFTYGLSPQTHHLEALGDKGMVYYVAYQLKAMMMKFDRKVAQTQNWDCYSQQFSPENVMQQFKLHFIEAPMNAPPLSEIEPYNWQDKIKLLFNSAYYFVRKKIANLGSSLTL